MEEKTSIGSIIATIIIIALIVLGGLYFWGKRIAQEQVVQTFTAPATTTNIYDNQIQNSSTSPITASSSTPTPGY
jgi:ABC-type phosphate transport system auxiliary subunit